MLSLVSIALFQAPVPTEHLESLSEIADVVRWTGVLGSLITILLAGVVLRVVDGLVEQMAENMVQWRMFLNKLRAVFHFLVYLVTTAVVVLLSFRLSGPVLTFLGGTAAVTLGFAFKDLVASLVAGVTIITDRPFQVGDRVSFEGYYGNITAIGLRSVRLQTLDDSTVTIPNSRFLTDAVSCGNYGELDMMIQVDFHISAEEDARSAREMIREIAVTSRYVYLEKEVEIIATQVLLGNVVATRLRLKAYVMDLQFEKAMETDITLRVLDAFQEAGIRTPAVIAGSDLPQV